jgi:hypothetical protein
MLIAILRCLHIISELLYPTMVSTFSAILLTGPSSFSRTCFDTSFLDGGLLLFREKFLRLSDSCANDSNKIDTDDYECSP